MTYRPREGRDVPGIVAVGMATALAAATAGAHEDPPGCFETGPAIIVSVFRANGTTGVVGTVSECETINYRARLQKAADDDSICAFAEGTFSLTTPDGVVHVIDPDVPCIGGTANEGCDPTVDFIESALIPYTVDPTDVVGGLITATAQYAGGVVHDSDANTAGVGANTPRSIPVTPCADNDPCTVDVCDPNVPGPAACRSTPIVCEDDDVCTTDACDPATGNCVFTPTVVCNDNDPCTDDICDPALGCRFVPNQAPGCVEVSGHFQCYEIKPFSFPARNVSVEDRFFDAPVSLGRPTHLCAPADKNGEDPTAPLDDEHLTGFRVRGSTGRISNLPVTNQFGTLQVDVIRRSHLMVPTAKSTQTQPPPLNDPVTDHFQCYTARPSRGTPRFETIPSVSVVDQFGAFETSLRRPRYLCVAANKNDEDPSAPANPQALLCYRTRTRYGEHAPFIDNQLLAQQVRIIKRLELCVPSTLGGGSPSGAFLD